MLDVGHIGYTYRRLHFHICDSDTSIDNKYMGKN